MKCYYCCPLSPLPLPLLSLSLSLSLSPPHDTFARALLRYWRARVRGIIFDTRGSRIALSPSPEFSTDCSMHLRVFLGGGGGGGGERRGEGKEGEKRRSEKNRERERGRGRGRYCRNSRAGTGTPCFSARPATSECTSSLN